MNVYRCDRCGEVVADTKRFVMRKELDVPTEVCKGDVAMELYVDICDKCRSDFITWFRQPKFDKQIAETYKKPEDVAVHMLCIDDNTCCCPVCGYSWSDDIAVEACPKCGTAFTGKILIERG